MLFSHDQLIGLKVVTKNGQVLGRVKDIIIETDNLKVKQIIVSKSKILDKILIKELVIGVDQIIEVTDIKVIVQDSAIEVLEDIEQTVSV